MPILTPVVFNTANARTPGEDLRLKKKARAARERPKPKPNSVMVSMAASRLFPLKLLTMEQVSVMRITILLSTAKSSFLKKFIRRRMWPIRMIAQKHPARTRICVIVKLP